MMASTGKRRKSILRTRRCVSLSSFSGGPDAGATLSTAAATLRPSLLASMSLSEEVCRRLLIRSFELGACCFAYPLHMTGFCLFFFERHDCRKCNGCSMSNLSSSSENSSRPHCLYKNPHITVTTPYPADPLPFKQHIRGVQCRSLHARMVTSGESCEW